MGKKRKFIDKRYDIVHTFKVVQRSQQDPLVADEDAPQAVLVDTECSQEHQEELHKYGVYFDDDYDYLQHLRGVQESVDWETCDLEVYTIRNEDPKKKNLSLQDGLFLPSSAFESYVEEPVGLLNKAAPITGPNVDLDPEIVAELDSDNEAEYFDPEDENGLPDDFVFQLNCEGDEEEEDVESEDEKGGEFGSIQRWIGGTEEFYGYDPQTENGYEDMPPLERSFEQEYKLNNTCNGGGLPLNTIEEELNEENDQVGDLPHGKKGKKKNRTLSSSRKSTSSSTLPRTELLRTFDAYFERFYNEEYSEDKIGALDGEVIEGPFGLDSPVFLQAYEATQKQFAKLSMNELNTDEKKEAVEWTKNNMKIKNDLQGEEEYVYIEMEPKLKHDLTSFLEAEARARANRRPNLPHVIDDRRPARLAALTKKAVKEHNQANVDDEESSSESSESEDGRLTLKSQISIFSQRAKDETKEEKRDRKKGLKELRKMRRIEKKISKLEYKELKKAETMKTKNKGNFRVVSLSGLI